MVLAIWGDSQSWWHLYSKPRLPVFYYNLHALGSVAGTRLSATHCSGLQRCAIGYMAPELLELRRTAYFQCTTVSTTAAVLKMLHIHACYQFRAAMHG